MIPLDEVRSNLIAKIDNLDADDILLLTDDDAVIHSLTANDDDTFRLARNDDDDFSVTFDETEKDAMVDRLLSIGTDWNRDTSGDYDEDEDDDEEDDDEDDFDDED